MNVIVNYRVCFDELLESNSPSQSVSIVSNEFNHSMPSSTEISWRFVALSLNMIDMSTHINRVQISKFTFATLPKQKLNTAKAKCYKFVYCHVKDEIMTRQYCNCTFHTKCDLNRNRNIRYTLAIYI